MSEQKEKAKNERVRASASVHKQESEHSTKTKRSEAPRRDLILPFNKLRSGTTYLHIEEQAKFTKVCDAFSVDGNGNTAIHDPLDPCKVIRGEAPVHKNYYSEKKWYLNLGRGEAVPASNSK